jgi:hypothetical protein
MEWAPPIEINQSLEIKRDIEPALENMTREFTEMGEMIITRSVMSQSEASARSTQKATRS